MKRDYTSSCFSYTALEEKKKERKKPNQNQSEKLNLLTRLQYDIALGMHSYVSYLKTKVCELLPQQEESYPSIRRK